MINNSIKRRIHLANSNPEKFNILTFPTHERYETQLCKTGHNFYSFNTSKHKKWNLEQSPYPENYYTLPENDVCPYLPYDFILVQSKFWQFQVAQQINQHLKLPIICLEHTWPLHGVQSKEQIDSMRNMFGNVNVFISEASEKAWDINVDGVVIHHGVDTDTFKPTDENKEDHVLSVANDFINRDYCLNYSGWKRVTKDIQTKLVGKTEGLSESVNSVQELLSEYNKCGVFFNSSTLSPIPTSLLEAMSCGCAVVSTATCMIPEIIQNGVNGFISNDENELREKIEYLLHNAEARQQLGENARQTIVDKFSESEFVTNWNNLFNEVYEVFQI
jgi:glycosyltransferase involved in cell wall biosynthesis